jgi:dTMP kinase
MSLFITFEGGEGSGKSVQARLLFRKLNKAGIPMLLTREPGGTPLGERIARWLKWGGTHDISPLAELMLFNASRAQLVTEVIKPGLKSGKVVICDRYADSTVAYQGYGRGLDLNLVKTVNQAFHRRIREGYLKLARGEPERWLMVDAVQSRAEIARLIWRKVSELLSTKK